MNSRCESDRGPATENSPALVVREFNPLDVPDWDSAIATLPGATFFHSRAWAAVLHTAYGFTPRYLVALAGEGTSASAPGDATFDRDATTASRLSLPSDRDATLSSRVLGVLPLMEVRSWLTGRRGVSLPFSDACAPAALDGAISRRLFREALERGRRSRWRYCEVRGGRETLHAPASLSYYGHSVDLRSGAHDLWARLPAAVGRAIRKAESNGIHIEFTTSADALDAFYGLLCRTRRRQGLPPQPRGFFDEVHRHVLQPSRGTIVLAQYNGRPIAGAVYFTFGRTALYKFGASDERFLSLRPNNLVMWRALQHYTHDGYETLDLGRTSMSNEGLRRFKQRWNAQELLIEYVRYDCHRSRFVCSRDSASGWHALIFRHLPLRLSRFLGALAYRHIA